MDRLLDPGRLDFFWVGPYRVERYIKPYCDNPVYVELHGRKVRKDLRGDLYDPAGGGGATGASLWAPCRHCEKCLFVRKQRIMRNMAKEIAASERTWLVTLTYRPDQRLKLIKRANLRSGEPRGSPGHAAAVTKCVLDDVSAYLKRLRAASTKRIGAKLRMCCIVEDHKDGMPHAHMLIHCSKVEMDKRLLRKGNWGRGFVDARLADKDAAVYLAKYLQKGPRKFRASVRYGSPQLKSPEARPEFSAPVENRPTPPKPTYQYSPQELPFLELIGRGTVEIEKPLDVAAFHIGMSEQADRERERLDAELQSRWECKDTGGEWRLVALRPPIETYRAVAVCEAEPMETSKFAPDATELWQTKVATHSSQTVPSADPRDAGGDGDQGFDSGETSDTDV